MRVTIPGRSTRKSKSSPDCLFEGDKQWHTPSGAIPRRTVRCAFRWLIANTNVDLESLAMGGPILLPEEYVPVCPPKIQKPCYEPGVWVNYGFDDPDAVRATKLMKTPQTQLQITPLVTGTFHLKDVQLQWLAEIVAPPTVAQR